MGAGISSRLHTTRVARSCCEGIGKSLQIARRERASEAISSSLLTGFFGVIVEKTYGQTYSIQTFCDRRMRDQSTAVSFAVA